MSTGLNNLLGFVLLVAPMVAVLLFFWLRREPKG
jgi:hypothetical protein